MVVIANMFAASIFLVIYDGVPARKIRKDNFVANGMNKDKGIVFYNALKLRTIFRGLLNILGTIIALVIVAVLMII